MDHFVTQSNQPPPLEVPWLCGDSDEQHDIKTLNVLYEYPQRAGFTSNIDGTFSLDHVVSLGSPGAAFLQRLMYFGLLGMVLHLQDMELDTRVFVRQTATLGPVIT